MKNLNIIEANSRTKQPYNMFYKILGGQPIKFDGRVDADSEAQARIVFRNKYSKVRDIEAIAETWFEIDQAELQKRINIEKINKRREEDAIKNAWWNRD